MHIVLALILCASGVIIIAPISMANDPYNRSWKKTSLSILWLLFITLTTFFAIFFYEKGIPHDESGKLNDLERLVQGFYFQLGVRVYLVFGLVLVRNLFPIWEFECTSNKISKSHFKPFLRAELLNLSASSCFVLYFRCVCRKRSFVITGFCER